MESVHSFANLPISCHSWNADRTQLALSLNDNDLNIYKKKGGGWEKTHVLSEHTGRITGVDWAAGSGQIVTCGADRNAYVWDWVDGEHCWKPILVLLRINRAATCVRWSPSEDKFAVGTGARCICVCYFDVQLNWWVSKHVRRPIRSTVLCLDWHPDNKMLVAGSTDFTARVFATGIKELKEKQEKTTWSSTGSKPSFGSLLAEFKSGSNQGGWVAGVSFSPSGNKIAWVTHSCQIVVVCAGETAPLVHPTFGLPFTNCMWISEEDLVVVGFDYTPFVYRHAGDALRLHMELDTHHKKSDVGLTAIQMFKQMDLKASTEQSTDLNSQHKNVIGQIMPYSSTGGRVAKMSTVGADGNLIIWKTTG